MIRALACLFALPALAQDCGHDAPCVLPEGEYRVAVPDAPAADRPAVVFYHGYGGSAAGTLRVTGMVNAFLDAGWVVIAPEGLRRGGDGPRSWSFFPGRPRERDELGFLRAMIADAAGRHGVDPDRVMVSGFSAGGFVTWYMACDDPTVARAFAPVAGAFWRPHPDPADCAGPMRLFHTHGWSDTTVPLEGRRLGSSFIQGDVFMSMDIIRQVNGCDEIRADRFDTEGRYWRRTWDRCADGSALELALHTGGHGIPPDWAPMAIAWFDGLDGADTN